MAGAQDKGKRPANVDSDSDENTSNKRARQIESAAAESPQQQSDGEDEVEDDQDIGRSESDNEFEVDELLEEDESRASSSNAPQSKGGRRRQRKEDRSNMFPGREELFAELGRQLASEGNLAFQGRYFIPMDNFSSHKDVTIATGQQFYESTGYKFFVHQNRPLSGEGHTTRFRCSQNNWKPIHKQPLKNAFEKYECRGRLAVTCESVASDPNRRLISVRVNHTVAHPPRLDVQGTLSAKKKRPRAKAQTGVASSSAATSSSSVLLKADSDADTTSVTTMDVDGQPPRSRTPSAALEDRDQGGSGVTRSTQIAAILHDFADFLEERPPPDDSDFVRQMDEAGISFFEFIEKMSRPSSFYRR